MLTAQGQGTGTDIWIKPMDAGEEVLPSLQSEYDETQPSISPRGGWIAYFFDETGTQQVFAGPRPDSGRPWQVSTNDGSNPV